MLLQDPRALALQRLPRGSVLPILGNALALLSDPTLLLLLGHALLRATLRLRGVLLLRNALRNRRLLAGTIRIAGALRLHLFVADAAGLCTLLRAALFGNTLLGALTGGALTALLLLGGSALGSLLPDLLLDGLPALGDLAYRRRILAPGRLALFIALLRGLALTCLPRALCFSRRRTGGLTLRAHRGLGWLPGSFACVALGRLLLLFLLVWRLPSLRRGAGSDRKDGGDYDGQGATGEEISVHCLASVGSSQSLLDLHYT